MDGFVHKQGIHYINIKIIIKIIKIIFYKLLNQIDKTYLGPELTEQNAKLRGYQEFITE